MWTWIKGITKIGSIWSWVNRLIGWYNSIEPITKEAEETWKEAEEAFAHLKAVLDTYKKAREDDVVTDAEIKEVLDALADAIPEVIDAVEATEELIREIRKL